MQLKEKVHCQGHWSILELPVCYGHFESFSEVYENIYNSYNFNPELLTIIWDS